MQGAAVECEEKEKLVRRNHKNKVRGEVIGDERGAEESGERRGGRASHKERVGFPYHSPPPHTAAVGSGSISWSLNLYGGGVVGGEGERDTCQCHLTTLSL